MAQRKVNGSEDLHRHADDAEPKRAERSKTHQREGDAGAGRETLCLLAARTRSPGGCRAAAPVPTGAAALTGSDLLNMHECLSRFPAALFTEDAGLCEEH